MFFEEKKSPPKHIYYSLIKANTQESNKQTTNVNTLLYHYDY